jgi:hypothetical protein
MTPKPVYDELKKLIKDQWWTTTVVPIQRDGQITFRGFYGRYRIKTTINGKTIEAWFDLTKRSTETEKVQLK